jgi:hypothetical protein
MLRPTVFSGSPRKSPDMLFEVIRGRSSVKYIDDEECAYIMQRYRECFDIYHAVLGIPSIPFSLPGLVFLP